MVLLPEPWGPTECTKRATPGTQGGPRRCKGCIALLELQLLAHPQGRRSRGSGQPCRRARTSAARPNRAFPTGLPCSLPGPYEASSLSKTEGLRARKRPKGHFFSAARNNFFKARESISLRALTLLLWVGVALYLSLTADFLFLKDAPKH